MFWSANVNGALRSISIRNPKRKCRKNLCQIDSWGITTHWPEIIPT
ncbi:5607_t:CDS:1, partial [Entrophospora sp. SA101]